MNERVNPDMIVLAREARRLSQKELAERIGVSQAKVSKFENGLLEVSDEDLQSIARATGYYPSLFLSNEQIVGLGSSMLFNRKREAASVTLQKEVQAKVNITRMQLLRMLRAAHMETSRPLARIDPDTVGGPRAVAQRLRAAWNLPLGPVQSVTNAIESAGGLIVLCDFGTDQIDGSHLWLPGAPPMFFMNAKVSGDRHRFNLAHELGHAVMHEFSTSDIEMEANEFAGEFLMPSQAIVPELQDVTLERLARLKQRWKVSMAALAFNAHALGCISDNRYRQLFSRLSAMGYRRNEPIEIAMEQPTLIRQLLELHRDSLGYTESDLRNLLMTEEPDFLQLPDTFKFKPRVRLDGDPIPFDAYRRRAAE